MNCNGIEGKVFNLARRMGKHMTPAQAMQNILSYWQHHETPQYGGIFHPKHKTDEEKRLARNAKARARRKKAKE